jgi:hypothetical protein
MYISGATSRKEINTLIKNLNQNKFGKKYTAKLINTKFGKMYEIKTISKR